MDGAAWKAAVHGVAEDWTWLSGFTFTLHFHALKKEMATHSSVLAWRIPGMGEPGGLPSMGSRRVGHDWSDLAAAEGTSIVFSIVVAPTYIPTNSEGGRIDCSLRHLLLVTALKPISTILWFQQEEVWSIMKSWGCRMQRVGAGRGEGDASRTFLSYLDPTNIWKWEEISEESDDLQGNGIIPSSFFRSIS